MKRKLVKQGQNALTVTLPSDWVKKHSLKPGDDVEVVEKNESIIVNPKVHIVGKRVEFNIDVNNRWYIGQVVRHCYFSGYKEVLIRFKDKSVLKTIRERVNQLLGFEIVDINVDSCLIRNISLELDEEFDSLYRKVFLLTKNLFDMLIKSEYDLDMVMSTYNDIMKFALFCRRVLIKELDNKKKFNNYILLQRWTMISNNLVYIFQYLSKNNLKLSAQELKYVKLCKEMYNIFYDALFKKDMKDVLNLNQRREEFIEEEGKIKKLDGSHLIIISYLHENIRMIASSCTILLNLIIN